MAFRILYSPASDASGVTITSSSDGSSNTDDNAVDNRVGKVWRTDTDTSEWIKFDLGSAQSVDCVGVFNHNLTSSATLTLEGHTSDSWGTPDVSETITIATDSDSNVIPRACKFFTSQSKRWWRLTVDDASNSDTYIQIGRIMFGAYYEATRDISSDLRVELIDPSEGDKTPGEVPVLTQKARFRRIRTSFEFVDQTETDKWDAIFDYLGNSRPAMIGWDSDRPTKSSAYVYMATPLSLAHQFVGYHNIASIVWEEKTR